MHASRPHEKRKSPPLKSSKMSKAGGAAGRSRAGRLFSERRRVDAATFRNTDRMRVERRRSSGVR